MAEASSTATIARLWALQNALVRQRPTAGLTSLRLAVQTRLTLGVARLVSGRAKTSCAFVGRVNIFHRGAEQTGRLPTGRKEKLIRSCDYVGESRDTGRGGDHLAHSHRRAAPLLFQKNAKTTIRGKPRRRLVLVRKDKEDLHELGGSLHLQLLHYSTITVKYKLPTNMKKDYFTKRIITN